MDQLDLADVIMSLYAGHRQTCSFERVILYFGWLRYDTRRVRYLLEKVLRQFGFVQTVPRHPCESASPQTTLSKISYHYAHHLDHMLSGQDSRLAAMIGNETSQGYI